MKRDRSIVILGAGLCREISWERMISTIPLPALAGMCRRSEISSTDAGSPREDVSENGNT